MLSAQQDDPDLQEVSKWVNTDTVLKGEGGYKGTRGGTKKVFIDS